MLTVCHLVAMKFFKVVQQVNILNVINYGTGFPGGSVVKNLPANAGDMGSIPGLGRALGVGNDNALQYSYLENSTDRGAWWATVYGVTKEVDTTE